MFCLIQSVPWSAATLLDITGTPSPRSETPESIVLTENEFRCILVSYLLRSSSFPNSATLIMEPGMMSVKSRIIPAANSCRSCLCLS